MITSEEARKYVLTVGKRGFSTLSTIERLRPFVEMLQSDVGSEFLREDCEQHSILINKIYEDLINKGTAEQKDVIGLQLLHIRIKKIHDRLRDYHQNLEKVTNARTSFLSHG